MPRKTPPSTAKRPRASKPKVKTGCLTCKIRHLKCDETKPHCTRCLSTGRTCDGYLPPLHRPPPPLPPSTSALTTLPGTPPERHTFHTFLTTTAPQLRGLFASPFWERDVLQVAMREEAVWHAVVAVGGVHCGFAGFGSGGKGWEGGEEFAVRQYVRAIECLVRPGGERRVDVMLIACVLFTCFESLRGHHAPALTHLDNGINLLLELQSHPRPTETKPTYPSTPYTPLPALQTLLMRLDTQAAQLLPSRRPRLPPLCAPRTEYVFESLEDAQRAGDELWNYCLYTLQPPPPSRTVEYPSPSPTPPHPQHTQQEPSPSPSPSPPNQTLHTHLTHLQHLHTTALTTYLSTHPPTTPRAHLASTTLLLHSLVATLSLSPASQSDSETAWRGYTDEFRGGRGVG